MNIFVSGGTGFVGTYLSEYLLTQGHHVTAIGTSESHPLEGRERFTFISDDTSREGRWQDSFQDMDAVINLAGRNIFRFWTQKYKSLMYDSRVLTTRNIVNALPEKRNVIFLSTSAAGYYGSRDDEKLDETVGPGDDFLARLCKDWEKEAFRAEEKGTRVVTMRFGVVLGRDGGALAKMIPAFKCFAGGPLGNGMQWFPWIHMDDLISAIHFLIDNREANGPMNFCAPGPVRQRNFAKALGNALHRPSFLRTPAFVLRTFMGELGSSLLGSQRVFPRRLLDEGFVFQYHEVKDALHNLIG
ncbi:MAG: TIGR01777 family oxidoreductase [Deltaproteobacteria bacterium]|nr:TIGR01777 family oxidoreductase [Deltaproteobacteria bacterium]